MLVERGGRLVGRDELMGALWPDVTVEEGNVDKCVHKLRKAMGDGQGYIETVPKHGYRFVAEVRSLPVGRGEVLVERSTLTHTVTEEELQIEGDAGETGGLPSPETPAPAAGSPRRAGRALPFAVALLVLSAVAALALLYRPWATTDGARHPETPATAARPPRTIAVLPFKTIGAGQGDEEYLGLGMTDALITRLGHSRQIVVRPSSAVRRYADPHQDPVAAGRQQGVDAVLDGSIQRAGDRLRVTVQLINVHSGKPLWSEKFDEPFTDIFSMQDSISQRVMSDLLVELDTEERARFGRRGTESVEAYQAYLRGRHFWNKRTIAGYRKAFEHFNQAIELDPAYALAYVGLADAILFLGDHGAMEKKEAVAKGRAALRKAVEIDDSLAEPHASLGLIAMNNDWNWAEAEREFRRAIELNPNYATAHHWYGAFLGFMGRFDEAHSEIRRAQELDPLSLIISTADASIYFLARQYDQAIEKYKKILETDPNFSPAHIWLGFAYSLKGMHEEAIAEFHKIEGLEDNPLWLSYLGFVYGRAGRREQAQRVLERLTALSGRTYVLPHSMALVHLGLGNNDEVFKWYERVFEEHSLGVIDLKVNPGFDSLRSDPRFADLLRRANFTH